MPLPVVAVIVAVLVGTLVAVVVMVLLLVRRLSRVARDVQELERRLQPTLAQLQLDAQVTSAELERVGDGLAQVRFRPFEP